MIYFLKEKQLLNYLTVTLPYSEIFNYLTSYVTLDHKTSHKGQFFQIEIYTSSES